MDKLAALENVTNRAMGYDVAKQHVEESRLQLFEAIKLARTTKATQQEIADRTALDGGEGLSRQRIAQIIQGV